MKATLVFIFGPNLKTKTLLRPRPKLNNNKFFSFRETHPDFESSINFKNIDYHDLLKTTAGVKIRYTVIKQAHLS